MPVDATLEKPLPNNLDAERSVLGAILLDNHALNAAIESLRRGEGPYLLECMTHRMAGHYVGDSQQYRSKEELAEVREKCPIERLKRYLAGRGVNPEELETIGEQARIDVQRAVERALAAPRPDPATVLEFVYRAPALAAIPG